MCEPPPLAFRLKWGLLALEIEHRTKPPKEQEKVVGTFSLESCDCQIHPLLNQDKLRKRLLSPCGSVHELLLQLCQTKLTVVDTLVCVLQNCIFSQTVPVFRGTEYCVPRLHPCGLCNRRSNGSFGCSSCASDHILGRSGKYMLR